MSFFAKVTEAAKKAGDAIKDGAEVASREAQRAGTQTGLKAEKLVSHSASVLERVTLCPGNRSRLKASPHARACLAVWQYIESQIKAAKEKFGVAAFDLALAGEHAAVQQLANMRCVDCCNN